MCRGMSGAGTGPRGSVSAADMLNVRDNKVGPERDHQAEAPGAGRCRRVVRAEASERLMSMEHSAHGSALRSTNFSSRQEALGSQIHTKRTDTR